MVNALEITIIGITDRKLNPSPEVEEKISAANWFAGGKRHFQLVKHILPDNHIWHDITAPLTTLFDDIKKEGGHWVIFASGDPLFYGIGNTLLREFPIANIKILPSFNSLQTLAHNTSTPYGLYKVISLTGRPWIEFDAALIKGEPYMALLTDKEKTPDVIARRMLDFGYRNYSFIIGECVGSDNEKISRLSVMEAACREYNNPNCLFVTRSEERCCCSGIPDDEFEGLPNRPRMITKMPIRLTTIALLKLQQHDVFWDVGACTGSISVEAKIQSPHIKVHAFEIREECEDIIKRNCQKFGIPGINLHIADFLQIDKNTIDKPDVVFLGGYGGKMEEVLIEINSNICNNGIIAFNAVSEESKLRFIEWGRAKNYSVLVMTTVAVDAFNPITIVIIRKENG